VIHLSGLINPNIPGKPGFTTGLEGWELRPEDNPESWANRPYPNEPLYATLVVVGKNPCRFAKGSDVVEVVNDSDFPVEVKLVYNGVLPWYGYHAQEKATFSFPIQ
jgi:hypothetical protein